MIDYLLSPAILAFIALSFQAVGLAVRDELWLRILIFSGTCFYILYYFFKAESPLWEVIAASGVLGLINLIMIILLIRERTTFTMSEETARIYESFPTLNPGQFRKVLKAGEMRVAPAGKVLVTEGKPLNDLILLVRGEVDIAKGNTSYRSEGDVFIGEVSFLHGGEASATVSVSQAARYLVWDHAELRRMMEQSSPLNNALIALFSAELADKVKNAMPVENS